MKASYVFFLFLLTFSMAQGQWTNLNPVPDANNLNSVFFIDDSTGWIVGTGGLIKTTSNAGLDWTQQSSGTNLALTSVRFVSKNIGWVCGEAGLILKTTDGGQNWFELISGTLEKLSDIHFYDLNTGWVVGNGETILKTTNGGSSWISQSSGTSFTLNSVDFVDDLLGYAVGWTPYPILKILKTADGGLNWIDISSNLILSDSNPSVLNTVKIVDNNNVFIGGTIGGGPNIWKTINGGETWIETQFQSSLNLQKQSDEIELTGSFQGIMSIFFKDSNIGYAVGGYEMGYYTKYIYTTTDGGSTWVAKHSVNDGLNFQSVYGNSSGKGWAVGYSGVIFITEDEGNSWVQTLNACDIHSVFFINENIGWAVGIGNAGTDGDIILKTTNGGRIWKTQLFGSGSYGTNRSVFFINENIGWTAGDEGVFITTNGGENWTDTVGIRNIESIFFIDQNTGWAVKETDNIYFDAIFKTTDGGYTWTPKSTQSSSSVFFANALMGWAVGDNGSILKSTDGGETWVTKSSGTTNDLNCVKFYDSNFGVCVGNSGTVLFSTNGGETWIFQNYGSTNDLQVVTFTNSTSFWIAGLNGEIISTTNLGNDWTSYTGITTNDLTSLCFINENTGWIGGLAGTLFQYQSDILPVELISFAANTNGNSVTLDWSTSTETNNSGFEIEREQIFSSQSALGRSVDNYEWTTLEFITGRGTTTETQSYSFVDENLVSGKYIYRLKQIDFDGTFEYSDEIEVEVLVPEKFELSQNYPNPFNPSTTIRYSIKEKSNVELKIYDLLGSEIAALVNEEKAPGNYDVSFDASSLSSGVYLYTIKAGNFVQTRKMLLMK